MKRQGAAILPVSLDLQVDQHDLLWISCQSNCSHTKFICYDCKSKNHLSISSDFLFSKIQYMLQASLAELCWSMSYRELSLNEDNATQRTASGSLQATPAEILQDREPFGLVKETSTGQNANQMLEDDGPHQDAKSQAQEGGPITRQSAEARARASKQS